MTATHITYLQYLGACDPAIEFASDYSSLSDAYAACTRPEWLFWLAGRTGVSRQDIVLAAECACARTALPFATGPEALFAIETAEAWCRGEATAEQVRTAKNGKGGKHSEGFFGSTCRWVRRYLSSKLMTIGIKLPLMRVIITANASAANANAACAANAANADARVNMCDLIRAIIPCPEVVCVE